jgi:protein-disulfide isomerase
MRSNHLVSCVAWLAVLGCASGPQKTESANGASPPASAIAAQNAACDEFTGRMCAELGNESEACMSLRSVREWLPPSACAAAKADIDTALARVKGLRKTCLDLGERLCAEPSIDKEDCEAVRRDMQRIPPGNCAVLVAHYPELQKQVQERAERKKPLSDELWSELLAGAPPAHGPADAKVTVIEFSDFQCPYCAAAGETVKLLREKYGDKVRVVFRQFPLSFHENARVAAQASLAAHAQGKFWELHDLMFEHQAALDRPSLDGYAKQLGLDLVKWKAAMDDAKLDEQVHADMLLGRKAQVDGTPTMFINGKRAENPTEWSEVDAAIQTALAR